MGARDFIGAEAEVTCRFRSLLQSRGLDFTRQQGAQQVMRAAIAVIQSQSAARRLFGFLPAASA